MRGGRPARAPQRAEAGRALGGGERCGRLPAAGAAVQCAAGLGARQGRGAACEGPLPPAALFRAAAGGSAFVLPPHLSARLGGTAQVGAGTVDSGGRSPEPVRGGKAVPCCGGRSRGCGGRLRLRPEAGAAGRSLAWLFL